ncbi:MAG: tetratricopeptide repeat-containing sensor histidine kinase [Cytophagales bacterium]|nr:tetratricopeptide repeat-containing sensor histidine kinase [Cytophagales bacterium]MCA6368451.1 tetratricopeptide repeat-containing sensor histidine kinase [Cytophagales bacterium]MCA6371771.1 tetratricopeptide repeat-containing sensor histidine kinase [Cytophagales bacterium]MCA6376422.1 tetratricopeptide repeat-containing sensor histidine kinase [Cytophagales bacterium]MCA6384970.1 tetratricopeptide repeat-containing sensor histidine kinase [Cytophagales bacterium]
MSKRPFFFFIFLVISVTALRGQSKVDSLNSLLNSAKNDSTRVSILLQLSSEYQFIELAKSEELVDNALKIAEAENLLPSRAEAYKGKASLESIKGDYTSAIKYNDLALSIFFQLKDSVSIAKCYNNLGTDYFGLGKFDESYFYHTQSYRLANTTGEKLQMAISLHNLGAVFKELGQYGKAFDYLKLSHKLSLEQKDLEAPAYYYSEVGDIFMRKNLFDSALISLKRALVFCREVRLTINELEPIILINIARTYLHKNDRALALKYYDSASVLFKKSENVFVLAKTDLGRGLVLMTEKKYKEAQALMEKSAATAHRLNARTLEVECYQNLSLLFEEIGDFKKSLYYFKRHQSVEDSLFNQGMQARLFQDQIRFETSSKEEQITALTKQEQLSKDQIRKQELVQNILVVTTALCGVLLLSVYRSGQRRIRINKLLLEHQDEIKKRSQELEQLNQVKDKFFSIISHDLRSPINALSGILDLMAKDQISPTEFSTLNKELRLQFNHTKTLINNLLDWTLLQMDKLKIQVEKIDLHVLADNNIKLLSSLHYKKIKITNKVTPLSFALGDSNMINLVVRNLLTNAIKFSEAGDLIEVDAKLDGENYIVSVKDSGVGISPEVQKILFEKTSGYSTRGTANEKGTGLGLILCKEFVERNGGKIWLESELGKGSRFFFTIKKGA